MPAWIGHNRSSCVLGSANRCRVTTVSMCPMPVGWVAEVDSTLPFLEEQCEQRGSQLVIALIVRSALRNGWRPIAPEAER